MNTRYIMSAEKVFRVENGKWLDMGTWAEVAAELDKLREELASVLDVALARGEKLGYLDDDYIARFAELTGREWSNEA